MIRPVRLIALTLAAAMSLPALARAQAQDPPRGILEGVGIDQKLDTALPLELPFRDETGKTVRLGDYFGEKPVILSLVYFNCPMLCTYVMAGLVRSLRAVSFSAGEEFEVLTVSFDPADHPALALVNKKQNLKSYGRSGAESGWHFLTGDEPSIRALTEAVGFRYRVDPGNGQFAHAAGLYVITPQGRIARYFFGVEYAPRDLRLALVEASQDRIGSPVDQVLLYCFHYDPRIGKYGLVIMNVLRVAGGLTVLALVGGVLLMSRWNRRRAGERARLVSG